MDTKDKRTKVLNDLIRSDTDEVIKNLIKDLTNKLSLTKGNKARNEVISTIKNHIPETNIKKYLKKLKQRSFKLIVSSLKVVRGIEQNTLDSFKGEDYYGRYLGDSPNQAAKKAFTQIFRKIKRQDLTEDIEIEFILKESTSDSDKKEYSYRGIATVQTRYMIVKKDTNGKRRVEYITDEEEIKTEFKDGKKILTRREGEEVYKISFKTKVTSLKNIIK